MIKELDIRDRTISEEVLELQVASYKIEAEIINYLELPPLKETIDILEQCGETFYGYFYNDRLCGVLSIKEVNEVVDIHRLFVHPDYFGRGIAQKLFIFLEEKYLGITIKTATASKNIPAVKFYKKNGFKVTKEIIVNERLTLMEFEKTRSEVKKGHF
ncbi:GNAT family N-acetyltransferase [Oceanobacillus luteolus]|uniref:GNAT family N-acetyltransferase n=1 Tax=Oceanobacillus luteolus TaxID=1274358 RepID=A0ABW4HMC0_9BACI|nr:GNAT family N-acetyltransferase [Oceanobacillus luteolus]MCM3740686.1 GNAT family N-acetyltransferase [Oceanobacillus luteolus]